MSGLGSDAQRPDSVSGRLEAASSTVLVSRFTVGRVLISEAFKPTARPFPRPWPAASIDDAPLAQACGQPLVGRPVEELPAPLPAAFVTQAVAGVQVGQLAQPQPPQGRLDVAVEVV